jgi:hypothetical protein
MPLSINPQAKLISSAAASVSAAASTASSAVTEQFASAKNQLNDKIAVASGALNSGLGPLGGVTGNLQAGASQIAGFAKTAMGGITSMAQSLPSSSDIANKAALIGSSISKLGLSAGGLGAGLQSAATSISSAAGMLSNILSLGRGKNLPAGAEIFKQQGAFVAIQPGEADDWRVRINANFGLYGDAFQRLQFTNGVVWPYTPSVTVSSKANYTQVDPVHSNQPFQAYKNSQIDDITISGEFSAETSTDAEYWIEATTFFKTATKMWFGSGDNVGNPPIICNLSGYGSRVFNSVPVIIKSFSVTLPPEVNYIKCERYGSPTWVPVLSEISVTLSPIYNRTKLREFNLKNYANGSIVGSI